MHRAFTSSPTGLSLGIAAAVALLASSCAKPEPVSSEPLRGTIRLDGSSTVSPLSELAGELFVRKNIDVRVVVGTSGTRVGFERFCRGEIEIADASRPISPAEENACAKAGIDYEAIGVANDGLAVAVSRKNDWATCLTIEELSRIWTRGSTVETWSQVRAGFPDVPLELFGPGRDSGTLDYFTEVVNGREGLIRSAYHDIGENDHAAVTGVAASAGAMAFIPLSFVTEAESQVRPLEIENASGECVAPSIATVQDGSYSPLGRQLFVYPSAEALRRPEVVAFLTFYVQSADLIAAEANFIPLTDDQRARAQAEIDALGGS